MNINIIAVGKIRENYIKSGIEEFTKRIQPYSSIKVIEIEPENLKNVETARVLETEADKILARIPDKAHVIVMDIPSKQLTSEEFAETIKNIGLQGTNQLIFIIGGAEGLSERVKKRADFCLSMSKMTLPHQIARLFLVEQIYRAFKILKNEPYHK